MTDLQYAWLGTVEYNEALALQRHLGRERALGRIRDTLLLLEHPPVYTTGRRDATSNLRQPKSMLGAPLIETDRGGDITFHGPGQLVAYPIIGLREAGLSVVSYVRALEDTITRTIARYGIEGRCEKGLTGVWVGQDKIAAIGVRVGKPAGAEGGWVTGHGLALNVTVGLDWFTRIVPCGIADRGVTSIQALTGATPEVSKVATAFAAEFGKRFGMAPDVNNGLAQLPTPLPLP